jgi:hypothetical protein
MSNPRAKRDRSKAKDNRQIPTPDRAPPKHRSKKHKPIILEGRYPHKEGEGCYWAFHDWHRQGRYRNTKEAATAKEALERNYGIECRIVGEDDE